MTHKFWNEKGELLFEIDSSEPLISQLDSLRKAAQMALDALDSKWHCMQTGDIDSAIKALRKELGQ
jgi:hypothetical protein